MLYQQTAQTLLFTRSFHLAILTDLYTVQMALPVKVTLFSHDGMKVAGTSHEWQQPNCLCQHKHKK